MASQKIYNLCVTNNIFENHHLYRANVTKVYDGDTVTVDIQLGMDIVMKSQSIRLYGINTPEVKGVSREMGLLVRDFVRKEIMNKQVFIQTINDKKGKYGRLLGVILYRNSEGHLVCLNDLLLENEMAIEYMI